MNTSLFKPTDETQGLLFLPEWTEYRKKRGLDPLGMQSSSVATYQRLLPGISNVTLRMRYYGLYAWLSRRYAREVGDTNPKIWQRFIRRAEALYALIAVRRGGELGVAGTQWASGVLDDSDSDIDFERASEAGVEGAYLKQVWGAYGAAYASQLHAMEIFAEVKGHDIPVPSEPLGEELASAFAEAVGNTADLFSTVQARGTVSRSELDSLKIFAPSEIPADSRECRCYQELLFAQHPSPHPSSTERKRTLLLVLHVADQIGKAPRPEDIRWMLYKNVDPAGVSMQLPPGELIAQQMRWRIYQANDLTHIVYETLLKYLLDLLGNYSSGIPAESLIAEVIDNIRATADRWPQTWQQLLEETAEEPVTAEETLTEGLMQDARLDAVCNANCAWRAITLLAVICNRTQSYREHIRQEFKHLDPRHSHSVFTELNFLAAASEENFDRVLHRILEQRILKQHLWVAIRKLRHQGDYTFLVESDDGCIRRRAEDGPVFTNPRLGPSVTFLKDTYLIDEQGLTPEGKRMLVRS